MFFIHVTSIAAGNLRVERNYCHRILFYWAKSSIQSVCFSLPIKGWLRSECQQYSRVHFSKCYIHSLAKNMYLLIKTSGYLHCAWYCIEGDTAQPRHTHSLSHAPFTKHTVLVKITVKNLRKLCEEPRLNQKLTINSSWCDLNLPRCSRPFNVIHNSEPLKRSWSKWDCELCIFDYLHNLL